MAVLLLQGRDAPRSHAPIAILGAFSRDRQRDRRGNPQRRDPRRSKRNTALASTRSNVCNAYAATLGLTIAQEFIDDGFGGSSLNRPAMVALRERMRAGEIASVIFSKLDRASRSLPDTLTLAAECDRYGTELCSSAEALDTSTAMGRAYLHMTGTFSELERGRIAERTAEGLAALRKRAHSYGPVPFGWRRIDDALVPMSGNRLR